jgi:hypothetical protein
MEYTHKMEGMVHKIVPAILCVYWAWIDKSRTRSNRVPTVSQNVPQPDGSYLATQVQVMGNYGSDSLYHSMKPYK